MVIIGAGPAGLTAADELTRRGERVIVLEQDTVVGGIARTVAWKEYRFDIGGHRFFTKSERVMRFWEEALGDDFLTRPRLSHIYYRKTFFSYPVRPFEVFRKIGPVETVRVLLSFLASRIRPRREEASFEDYVVNRFGEHLYRMFFKSYTEKVWGIPCSEIRAEWAAQRIKGISVLSAIRTAVFGNGNRVTSFIERFRYPRLGPGMLWERVADRIRASGLGEIRFGATVTALEREGDRITAIRYREAGSSPARGEVGRGGSSSEIRIPCSAVISSMPLGALVGAVTPALPEEARTAGEKLRYRDFIAVALVVRGERLFPDTWIYIHDPTVRVGRVQNFGNWSPELVPVPGVSLLGAEYFVNEGDDLWRMDDAALVALAARELTAIRLVPEGAVMDGTVVRMPKTYPVYDTGYDEAMPALRAALAPIGNLSPVGRNGMHRYNNQDHAMLTAMLAVENLHGASHDLWSVNTERVYHEEAPRA